MAKQHQELATPSFWVPILLTSTIIAVLFLTLLPTGIVALMSSRNNGAVSEHVQHALIAIQLLPAALMLIISVITFRNKEGFDWDADLKQFTKFQTTVWAISGFMVLLVEIIVGLFTSGAGIQGNARFSFILLSALGMLSTAWSTTVFSHVLPHMVLVIFLVWGAAIAVITLRGTLGLFRLVPEAWRKSSI